MTATLSTRKGGTKGMPRELRHMKPATWSLLGRSQALLGGLPLSTPLIRQRKTMRVTVKSSVRYVPTSSSIGDKPEAIGADGKESDAVFSVKMTSHEKVLKAASAGKRERGWTKGTKREADNVRCHRMSLPFMIEKGSNGMPSVSQILSYVLRRDFRATGSGACEASGSSCWTGSWRSCQTDL